MNNARHLLRPLLAGHLRRRACRHRIELSASLSSEATDEATHLLGRGEDGFRFGLKEEYAFRKTQEKARRDAENNNSSGTVTEGEVDKFRAMSSTWWDPDGWCKPLHSMNSLRVRLVVDGLVAAGRISHDAAENHPRPLEGVKIVDVGCGGGILCEPLARLGASVTGLEPAEESLAVAREHAALDPELAERLQYLPTPAEVFAEEAEGKFDAVVTSEVLEHVSDQRLFLRSCCRLAFPGGGSVFVTTLNRTRQSYLFGVVAAESVLGLLPAGTHDWRKFVTPAELQEMLEEEGKCRTRLIHGMFYWPVFNEWSWIPQTTVNYALHAIKE